MVMTRVWVLEMTLKSTQETPLVFVPLCLASYALTEKMGWYSAPGNEAQEISRGILAKIVSLIGLMMYAGMLVALLILSAYLRVCRLDYLTTSRCDFSWGLCYITGIQRSVEARRRPTCPKDEQPQPLSCSFAASLM